MFTPTFWARNGPTYDQTIQASPTQCVVTLTARQHSGIRADIKTYRTLQVLEKVFLSSSSHYIYNPDMPTVFICDCIV